MSLVYGGASRDDFQFDEGDAIYVPDNCVAYWHPGLDGAGAVVHDLFGKSHGTLSGVLWVGGPNGKVLSFDGTDDKITVLDAAHLDILTDITIEMLVQLSTGVLRCDLVEKGGVNGYAIYSNDGQTPQFIKQGDSTSVVNSNLALTVGKWYHIVGTKTGSVATIYLNGLERGQDTSFADFANTGDLTIGSGGDGYMKGLIALVRIYNKGMTARQVEEAYYDIGPLVGLG